MKAAFLVGGFFYGNTQKYKNCQKGKKCLACFIQIGKSLPQTPHKHGGDEVGNNRNAALSRIKAAHDELEIVSEGTGLTISERNELTQAILALDNLIDSLTYPYELNEPITEASFPAIGPFNTAALSEALAALSVRAGNEP
ncbi:hypothetical protein DTI93_08615 [Parasaccharibacter sp. TMW 2.1884]|nr:hypothetical protein [Parasaccharibacter sp. TMW 2.1884]